MALRDVALLALPVVTGLQGIIWAEAVARSGAGAATMCFVVAYAAVAAAIYAIGPTASQQFDMTSLAALTALNALTAVLWLVPIAGGTRYVSLALIEGAWPIFSILFAWLLFGRRELDLTSSVGGVLILIGAAMVFCKA